MPLFSTVSEAIARVGDVFPHAGYVFQNMRGEETRYSYSEVAVLTAARAKAMADMGLVKGDRIGIVVIEPEDFVLTFLAALRIGVIPVPLYPPLSFGALDAYADRTARVLQMSETRVLFASSKLQNVLWGLVDRVPTLERLVKVEELQNATGSPEFPEITEDDIAFLQYTSGSTSDPKGVIVTHKSLIANCFAIITGGLDMEGTGVAVSWLPLYHDMGLIGFVIATICHGLESVFIPTMRFIKKPSVWLDAISRHRGTVSFAPNFAYALATRKAKDAEIAEWDLSSMKAFGCGAEPIQAENARNFNERFAAAKLDPNAFLPAYGMAEATLAISFKPLDDHFRTRVVDADIFTAEGRVEENAEATNILEHVSCGPIFKDHEMVAMDEQGNIMPEGHEGELCMKGPSVTPGYYNNPEATAISYRGGWLHTGDLGYLLDGEIYVTGRIKDLVILNGRNIHPQSIEWQIAEVEGVRKGNVVAFSRPGATSEELIIALECKGQQDEARIIADVKKVVRKELGVPPAEVVCLAPGSLPKTSSGKLQRRKTRQQFLIGKLGAEGVRTMGASGNTLTVARHVAKSLLTRARTRLSR